jgi:hypothetical protein
MPFESRFPRLAEEPSAFTHLSSMMSSQKRGIIGWRLRGAKSVVITVEGVLLASGFRSRLFVYPYLS